MTENNQRPIWFTDWKKLWHIACKELGMEIAGYYSGGLFDGRRVRVTKDLYRQIRRVQRLGDRVLLESGVRDVTWCRELIAAIRQEDRKNE